MGRAISAARPTQVIDHVESAEAAACEAGRAKRPTTSGRSPGPNQYGAPRRQGDDARRLRTISPLAIEPAGPVLARYLTLAPQQQEEPALADPSPLGPSIAARRTFPPVGAGCRTESRPFDKLPLPARPSAPCFKINASSASKKANAFMVSARSQPRENYYVRRSSGQKEQISKNYFENFCSSFGYELSFISASFTGQRSAVSEIFRTITLDAR